MKLDHTALRDSRTAHYVNNASQQSCSSQPASRCSWSVISKWVSIHDCLTVRLLCSCLRRQQTNFRQTPPTCSEQPINECLQIAFCINWNRPAGFFLFKSNTSMTPPVKSSMASLAEPPRRFSKEPFSLQQINIIVTKHMTQLLVNSEQLRIFTNSKLERTKYFF